MRFAIGQDFNKFGEVDLHADGSATLTPRPGFEDKLAHLWSLLSGDGDPLKMLRHFSPPGRGRPHGTWSEPLDSPPGQDRPAQ